MTLLVSLLLPNDIHCRHDATGECQDDKSCDINVELEELTTDDIDESGSSSSTQMFFVESSGRDHLLPRQVCAVESAIGSAKVSKVIVTMISSHLNLAASNATCQLYKAEEKSGRAILEFKRLNLDLIFKDTQFYKMYRDGIFEQKVIPVGSPGYVKGLLKAVNLSDAIRIALIYKFGGWYSDLDVVFLKSISSLKNVIGSDEYIEKENHPPDYLGGKVTNAIFHTDKGHPFMKMCMKHFPKVFDGQWGSGGPVVLHAALQSLCNLSHEVGSKVTLSSLTHTAEKCQGINVVSPK